MHSIPDQIREKGYAVCPNFLAPQPMKQLRADFSRIESEGGFSRAGTGQGQGHAVGEGIRRDSVHWLDRSTRNTPQAHLWKKVEDLQRTLNRNFFFNLNHFEGHYAAYPPGGFYHRHRDAFRADDSRLISFVLYLNKDWRSEDGGRLRIHGARDRTIDIDPVGGHDGLLLESGDGTRSFGKLRFSGERSGVV